MSVFDLFIVGLAAVLVAIGVGALAVRVVRGCVGTTAALIISAAGIFILWFVLH